MTLAIVAASAMGAPNEKPPDRRGSDRQFDVPAGGADIVLRCGRYRDGRFFLRVAFVDGDQQGAGFRDGVGEERSGYIVAHRGAWPFGGEMVGGERWFAMTLADVTSGVSCVARLTCAGRFARTEPRT